ncbi:MAG TPA: TIGR01777 family oxidoreductase [Candidatus Cybelea sp.]|nr:TIGR01777 family oxidoreductase [Candidatus Cybelea sp.]
MRVTVIGASGFIGRHLSAALRARGDDVVEASLRNVDAAGRACESADAVVQLAGAPVATRWTARAKDEIRRSRVDATRELVDRLARLRARPNVYVAASAVGYYGASETATFTESSPPGNGFLAEVCVGWEREASRAGELGMRVACIRTGIVLGSDGGALARLLPIFKLGLGGVVGNGRQWNSWIHIDDIVGIYLLAIDRAEGALNATAPDPVRNVDFTWALASALHRPAFLPVPAFALRTILGEGASVLTTGQRVLPERPLALGYKFARPRLAGAFTSILSAATLS